MKRFFLPILVLLLLFAALGSGIWILTRSVPEHAGQGAELAETPVRPAGETPVALEGPGASGTDADSTRSSGLPALPEGAIVLRGAIQRPAGIQDPGPVVVYALSKKASYRELARLLDRPAKAEAEKPDDDALQIVAQCNAAADGKFELALPQGTKHASIALQGQFLYLDRTRELDLARTTNPQIVAKAGALLRGGVKLPEGTGIAALEALRVELDPVVSGAMAMRPDRPPHRGVPATGGAFEMRAVPAEAEYRLGVESEAFAYSEKLVDKLRPGETRAIELALEPGGTLRGLVHDPDGKPCGSAEVEVAREGDWFGTDDKAVRSAKCNGEGAFELAHVPAGKLKLRASAPGFLSSERLELELAPGRTSEGLLVVLRAGKSVAGMVAFADGKPAPGAEVQLTFDLSQAAGLGGMSALEGANGEAKADAEGHFTIGGLGNGPFTLRASGLPAGRTLAQGEKKDDIELHARTDGVTPGTQDLQLVLRAGAGLSGRVVDPAQQPVAKFKVKVQHEGKGLLGGLGQDSEERNVEDAEGRFKIGGLAEGSWKLWVTSENFANGDATSVILPQAPDGPELVVTLMPSCTASGRVVSARGEPVGGAHVTVDSGGPAWQKALSGAPPDPDTESEADGSFRLTGLKPGQVALVASAQDYARSLPQTLEIAAGTESKDIVLTLRDGGSISGEVYDEQGKPISGMFVQVTEMAVYDIHFANTEGEGRFKIEHLQPGNYQVVAFPGKALGKAGSDKGAEFMNSMKMTTAEVRDGEDTHVVLGAPPADPVQVVGRVTHAGQPYAGALVSFVHEGKDVLTRMKTASVDAQGAFEVRLGEPGRYAISVQRMNGGMGQQNTTEFLREIPKEKRYELLLEMPTGRISGKVLDPEGKPAQGERVTLHPRSPLIGGTMWGGMYVEAQTNASGAYDIEALRAGEYVIAAGGMSMGGMFGADAAHGRELRSDIKVGEGDWLRDIDFRLRKPARVDVLVVGEDNQPIAKAAIFARDANGSLLDRLSMVATDESGLAHYGGLAPGEYSFSSRMDVRASAEGARVKLAEGESKEVKLVLSGASVLLVTVQDAQGQTVQSAVSVLDAQGHEAGGMFGLSELMEQFTKNGVDFSTSRIGPLPPGKYTVTARTADGKTGSKPVSLTGQPERKLTIRVE